jgi:hypothetical protein
MEDFEMKDKKNMKWIPVLFYIASACYFFVACMNLFGDGSVSTGLIYMSLGSLNIALGSVWTKKVNEEYKEE